MHFKTSGRPVNIVFLELFGDTDEPRLPGDLSRAERMSLVDVLVRGGSSAAGRARKTGSAVSGVQCPFAGRC